MKLINNDPSPYGRKVRIALAEKGIPYEAVDDIPWIEGTVVPEYNPLEQLPILISDQDDYIYESSYILEWLERHYPEPPLLPSRIEDMALRKRV